MAGFEPAGAVHVRPVAVAVAESPLTVKSGKACLEQTQETAQAHGIAGPLTQVPGPDDEGPRPSTSARTATATSITTRTTPGAAATWVEGKSAIFLTEVVRKGGTYEATADDGVVFSVTSSRLLIRHKDGSTEVQYSSR